MGWPGRREEGAVLVIGMLTLVLLTVLGVAATNTSTIESEIAGNEKTYQQNFYAAELALVSGENVLETLTHRVELNEGSIPGHYGRDALSFDRHTFQLGKKGTTPSQWQAMQWNSSDSAAVTNLPSGLSKLGTTPRYTIAERDFKRHSLRRSPEYGETGVYYYNVTALGTSAGQSTNVLLETIYARRD